MSSKTSVSKADAVLRQALDLSPGDITYIRCADRNEMESMRTLIFMARRRVLTTDPGIDSKVRISRHNDGDLFAVKITRMNEMDDSVLVVKKDGTVEQKTLFITPRKEILERLDDMVRSGLSLATISEFKYSYFIPNLFPDTNEVDKAIEWLAQEQKAGRMTSFVIESKVAEPVKVLPVEEIFPPRDDIADRIAVDIDDGYSFDEIEERLKEKFPLEYANAMKWARNVGEEYFKKAIEE